MPEITVATKRKDERPHWARDYEHVTWAVMTQVVLIDGQPMFEHEYVRNLFRSELYFEPQEDGTKRAKRRFDPIPEDEIDFELFKNNMDMLEFVKLVYEIGREDGYEDEGAESLLFPDE